MLVALVAIGGAVVLENDEARDGVVIIVGPFVVGLVTLYGADFAVGVNVVVP